ncbi:KIR protein [Plasmodium coatneyi]|uniref:KIR protein n=1 Tax=Plasmodium coatneyi TaxID=208452 RepID=A0A1B1E6I7_9APIC|nr:KIR protein [Plasmodium coatneyi]ANQ10608.1 KIR protein [Plasmodium coatneyi]
MKRGECNVNTLPSKQIYAKFEENKNGGKQICSDISTWTEGILDILGNKLKQNHMGAVKPEEIANVWCSISKLNTKEKEPPPSCKVGVVCNFFYFWLGDKLEGKLQGGNAKLKEVIQSFFNKLSDSTGLCASTFLSSTMDTTFLKQRKKVFDYYYDYQTIWNQIKNSGSDGSSCAQKYDSYLNGVEEISTDGGADDAYRKVQANCPSNGGDNFCTEFWKKKFQQNGHGGCGSKPIPPPSQLKEKATSPEEVLPPASDEEDSLDSCLTQLLSQHSEITSLAGKEASTDQLPQGGAGGGTTTPVVASSALGIVGLPALAFFLYKVKLPL